MSGKVPSNLFSAFKAIDAVAVKVEGIMLEHYRAAVWAVFEELVYTTPQFSGKAVANWNIGIDAPDFSFDPKLGDTDADILDTKDGKGAYVAASLRKVGDQYWAEYALLQNKYKLKRIKSKTRVYITNATQGNLDELNGRSSTFYLADLQDPSYWAKRLRAENKGAERVTEVLMTESWRGRLRLANPNQNFFQ